MKTSVGAEEGLRDKIEQAARDIAYESGLSGVSLGRVARRAGVDPATVAGVEASMTALTARVFQRIAVAELEDIEARIPHDAGAVAALDFLVEEITASCHGNENWVWVDAWALGSRNAHVAQVARESTAAWTNVVERLIVDGIGTGEFVSVDAGWVAQAFVALLDGSSTRACVEGDATGSRAPMLKSFLTSALTRKR